MFSKLNSSVQFFYFVLTTNWSVQWAKATKHKITTDLLILWFSYFKISLPGSRVAAISEKTGLKEIRYGTIEFKLCKFYWNLFIFFGKTFQKVVLIIFIDSSACGYKIFFVFATSAYTNKSGDIRARELVTYSYPCER